MPPAVHPFSVAGDKCDMNKRFHLIPATSPPPRSRTQPRRHPLDPTLPRGPARTRPRRPASLPSLPHPCAPKARPVCVQASTSVAAPRGPGPPTCRPRAPPLSTPGGGLAGWMGPRGRLLVQARPGVWPTWRAHRAAWTWRGAHAVPPSCRTERAPCRLFVTPAFCAQAPQLRAV